jgi:hypothetical protein
MTLMALPPTVGTSFLPERREVTGGLRLPGLGIRHWIRESRNAEAGPLDLALEFQELAAKWHEDTEDLAASARVVAHPAYLRIISLGRPILPQLLRDLHDNGGLWFPALEAITGVALGTVEERKSYRDLRQLWLDWGHEANLT